MFDGYLELMMRWFFFRLDREIFKEIFECIMYMKI